MKPSIRVLSEVLLLGAIFWIFPFAANAGDAFSIDENALDSALFSTDLEASRTPLRFGQKRWQLTLAGGISSLNGYKYSGINYELFGYQYSITDVSFDNGTAIEGALYYQVLSILQIGVVGGYSFGHEHKEYVGNFFGADYYWMDTLEIAHASGVLRLGHWFNRRSRLPWRPYVEGGLGWYSLIVRRSWWYDPGAVAENWGYIYNEANDYLGSRLGAGTEFEVYSNGVIGAQATYVRVNSHPEPLKFYTYTLRFSYLF